MTSLPDRLSGSSDQTETSLSIRHKEKFCERVRVGNTLPVSFIPGIGDREQFGIEFLYVLFFHRIMPVTHTISLLTKSNYCAIYLSVTY